MHNAKLLAWIVGASHSTLKSGPLLRRHSFPAECVPSILQQEAAPQ